MDNQQDPIACVIDGLTVVMIDQLSIENRERLAGALQLLADYASVRAEILTSKENRQ